MAHGMAIRSEEGQQPGPPSQECRKLRSRHSAGGDRMLTNLISNTQAVSECPYLSAFNTTNHGTLSYMSEHQPALRWERYVTTARQACLLSHRSPASQWDTAAVTIPPGKGSGTGTKSLLQWNGRNSHGGDHSSVFPLALFIIHLPLFFPLLD